MPKSKAEIAAKQRLANAKAKVRTLMIAGRTADAEAYAASQGFDVFAARLAPEYQNDAEPMFAALEQARAKATGPNIAEAMIEIEQGKAVDMALLDVEEEAAAPESINGWPVLTEAVVWGIPPNKSLVVIELPDKRRVSMWRTRGATYRIHARLRARIAKTEGDPIYEEVRPDRPVF